VQAEKHKVSFSSGSVICLFGKIIFLVLLY